MGGLQSGLLLPRIGASQLLTLERCSLLHSLLHVLDETRDRRLFALIRRDNGIRGPSPGGITPFVISLCFHHASCASRMPG